MNIPLKRVHIFSIFVHGLQEFGYVGRFGHPRHVLVFDKHMNDFPKYWKIFCVPRPHVEFIVTPRLDRSPTSLSVMSADLVPPHIPFTSSRHTSSTHRTHPSTNHTHPCVTQTHTHIHTDTHQLPRNSWVLMQTCNASFAYSTTQQKEYEAQ
jgi:hypothetical protein